MKTARTDDHYVAVVAPESGLVSLTLMSGERIVVSAERTITGQFTADSVMVALRHLDQKINEWVEVATQLHHQLRIDVRLANVGDT
jgi:hypothetical protein